MPKQFILLQLDSIEVALFLGTVGESREDNEDIVTIECITIALARVLFFRRTMFDVMLFTCRSDAKTSVPHRSPTF